MSARLPWRPCLVVMCIALVLRGPSAVAEDDAAYYHTGPLAGSLKSADPLPIYDTDPQHLWNRLFAALYIRPSNFADAGGGPPVARIEGGDTIDFLGWAGTTWWDEPAVAAQARALLDEFKNAHGAAMIDDPLHRAILLRDLWAAFDFLVGQNIRRTGSLDVRRERDALCGRLARIIETLTLPRAAIDSLPDNYAAALASGEFATDGRLDPRHDYLPAGLFTEPDEWVEIDFFRPDVHEDLSDRRLTLHTRSYRGRSYFRIFYRFPAGRAQLDAYLKQLDAVGVDWRQAAQDGFIQLKPDAPQIPIGTEVALVQFMMMLDENAPVDETLHRDHFGMHRFDWEEDNSTEFHIPHGEWIRLLRSNGFDVEDLVELRAPEGVTTRFPWVTPEWARRWPSEEVWKARKR